MLSLCCLYEYVFSRCINLWMPYETWYLQHGTWAQFSAFLSVCVFVYISYHYKESAQ
jgi:hypothetical protein